jgi:hypothetical protein
MMNTRVCLGLALCGLLAAVSTGCSSTMVARGQDALPEPFVRPASYGYQPELQQVLTDSVHGTDVDHYNVPANNPNQPVPANWHHLPTATTATGWNGGSAAACPPGGGCPQCPPHADCPHCQGHPANGQACPFCQNSGFGPGSGAGGHVNGLVGGAYNHLRGPYPKHHFTYSYQRPQNLSYPPPQVPGGVVVYPYYTLKGPSDFFRQ